MDKIAFFTNKYIHLLTDGKCEWVKDSSLLGCDCVTSI